MIYLTRRNFLKLSGSGVIAWLAPRLMKAEKTNRRPDIVIIIGDDIGYSDFGCYGGEIPTPNINSLTKSG